MVQIAGQRTTLNINQNRRVYDVEKKVHLLEPNQTPIYTILAQMPVRKVVDPSYNWHEDALIARTTRCNLASGYGTSETSIVVDDATIFVANDVVQVTGTGENMLITAVTASSNTLTVTRGLGGTTAANIAENAEILAIGPTYAEGTTSSDAVTTQVTRQYNFTQIFKKSIDLTETEAVSEMRDEKDEKRLIAKGSTEYKRDIESAFLYGSRNEATVGGKPRRQTGGLTSFVTTNVTDNSAASLTSAIIDTWLRPIFDVGDSDTRWVFGSATFMQAVKNIAESNLRTLQGDETFGLAVTEWITPFGRTFLKLHRDLTGDTYGNYAIAVDMPKIKRAVLRPSKLKMNVQANDSDSRKHEYISEQGMQVTHESVHGIIKNFTI
jgi:hypothetical protein